ncbi:30S ribosomal protein S12 methylthiotransferase RimO [Candidatus Omnitrophota bacterium]
MRQTVGIISLGCPRNLVDSECLLGLLKKEGFRIKDIDKGVDVAIVNTCAFIKDAKEESVDMILQASDLKKEGKVGRLIVAGCLAQRYAKGLAKDLPEVDAYVGTSDYVKIPGIISRLGAGSRFTVSKKPAFLYKGETPRTLLTPKHSAYIKVSEGCNNLCSYCVIPQLRGALRSRPIGSVCDEITALPGRSSLREINIIGQDTTLYGADLYGRPAMADLLKRICRQKNNVGWVRLLYTHPAHYDKELIEFIAKEEKMCKYLDLPIQHINDRILKKMNRHTAKKDIIALIRMIREAIPSVAIRTSVIVGFPGEHADEFGELMDFIKETKFERLGAFIYSREEGTKAAGFKDQVPEDEKRRRFDEVMKLQREVSSEVNMGLLGKKITVLIEEKEKEFFTGRSQWDAPEVDGVVYVAGSGLKIGEFCQVRIKNTLEYDLVGEAVK